MQVWPLKPRTSGCVQKAKFFWSFPWHGSNSLDCWPSICLEITRILPFITPLKSYIRNSLDTLKAWGIESKKTIVHCFWSLYLSLHPFVPWSTFVFFPRFPFSCDLAIERWTIEVVEAQVEDSVSPIRRHADRGCIHCNLWFYINRNIFSCPIMYVWMNILSMDDFKGLYIVDYIC